MKVVLFCGGFGMRLREYSESIPKPLVQIGTRPILWNVMRYYAHYGHKDFVLCLGWKSAEIKRYFLGYDECMSNDFVLEPGGSVSLMNTDIHDWNIAFVETGPSASITERLLSVREHVRGEEYFLANYTDGLCDLPLPEFIDNVKRRDALAGFVSVRPTQSFHTVDSDDSGMVRSVRPISDCNVWMNGGYFVLNEKVFRYIQDGDELVDEPFRRLAAQRKLYTERYEGFWSCMDTYKEKQDLDDMYDRGVRPWEVWNQAPRPRIGLVSS